MWHVLQKLGVFVYSDAPQPLRNKNAKAPRTSHFQFLLKKLTDSLITCSLSEQLTMFTPCARLFPAVTAFCEESVRGASG